MQPQVHNQLSPKSRSILYHLKTSLKQHNLLLDTHICNIFQYRKQKLSRKQFHKIIRKFDQNLILQQIDTLFNQLNKNNKNYLLLTTLNNTLQTINQNDNPSQLLNRRSKLLTSKKQIGECNVLIELKDLLIQNQGYIDTIQLFVVEKDGFLDKGSVKELLDNLRVKDSQKINAIISALFGQNDKIEVYDFLQKLQLNNDGTRIRLSDLTINESILIDQNQHKSQYIKNQQNSRISQQFNIQYSKILDSLNQNMENTLNSGFYAIQKIPTALKPYFNYGSQLQQPFASLASNYIQNNLIYIDPQGPTYQKAKSWIHILQKNPYYLLFQAAESIVYRAQQRKGLGMLLQPKDITQGKFGNCYFLSAVAAIVESYPQLVYRLFVLQKNPSHIFGVRLFIDGIWRTIAVDGCFPLNAEDKFCGAQPHHSQIWVMLLQKAWAKVFKTYQNIHSGYNQQGLVAISGAPTQIILIKQKNFLQKIQQQFKKGSIITCTTAKHVSQISQAQQQNLGVFSGHAYTILKIFNPIKIGSQQIILLKMKNPWGTKAWKGDWSFQSKKWTKQLRNLFNYNYNSKDGTYFICLQDFIKYFDHIHISKINLGNRNSHIINQTNRYDFYTNVIHIKQSGTYSLTIYQQNGRKYKNGSGLYQKSPSYIFLARVNKINENQQIQDLIAITCNASGYQHSSVQAKLQPGCYLLLSKVSWNYWEEHSYVISSYGPMKVIFQPCQVASIEILNIFISSYAMKTISSKNITQTFYKNTQIWKCFYFQHTQGLGFIAVGNNQIVNQQTKQSKMIQTTLTLDSCKGIQVLAPFTNPIVIKVKASQIVIAACLVDPQGYSYKLIQGYKLYMLKN